MSELQRYGQEWESIVEMPDGEYVLYDDVAPMLAELEQLRKDRSELARVLDSTEKIESLIDHAIPIGWRREEIMRELAYIDNVCGGER